MFKGALAGVAVACLIAGAAQAQSSWPNKPVKILVPTAAGGSASWSGHDSGSVNSAYGGSASWNHGTGSATKGFSLRNATTLVRQAAGLASAETLRREGAPIPMKPLKYWDNGRNVVLAGDVSGESAHACASAMVDGDVLLQMRFDVLVEPAQAAGRERT